ncbi:ADP-ribosylglycohydrolase family protein [Pseudaeromonas paramecii]|uniref:ADP-ribosylglycohydrolase family protein n=1 Tax=Pseudaeromonas paramecii TaxID=2138166 RepID=A0ABP8Q533_9GAMM
MTQDVDRAKGCLVGLAIGDAIGTTLEFRPRGSFSPLQDMHGGGHFCLPKGHWTDDTSMALCLGESLLACDGFDAADQMRRYCDWLDNGYQSSLGVCFDVGMTVQSALRRFQKSGNPYSGARSRWSSGNGSIMRLAPVVIAYQADLRACRHYAALSSRTTHASPLCLDACGLFGELLWRLLQGQDKAQALQACQLPTEPELATLQGGSFIDKSYAALKGSGFVVESLEAALWCFWHTDSFAECVLAAANLGDDADTTAAVAGQLAGAHYGHGAIRDEWCQALHRHHDIAALAAALHGLAPQDVGARLADLPA